MIDPNRNVVWLLDQAQGQATISITLFLEFAMHSNSEAEFRRNLWTHMQITHDKRFKRNKFNSATA